MQKLWSFLHNSCEMQLVKMGHFVHHILGAPWQAEVPSQGMLHSKTQQQ